MYILYPILCSHGGEDVICGLVGCESGGYRCFKGTFMVSKPRRPQSFEDTV